LGVLGVVRFGSRGGVDGIHLCRGARRVGSH
jgi:hypothetical protein